MDASGEQDNPASQDVEPSDCEYEVEDAAKTPIDPVTAPRPDVNEIWEAHQEPERASYSLQELLVATAIASVVLSVSRLIRPSYSAALMGLIVMLGLAMLSTGWGRIRYVAVSWWVFFVLYLVFSAYAIWQGDGDALSQ
jgi:hypothetical protein